jgi:hypothetical protein
MNTRIGSLPKHQYIYVDSRLTHKEPCGFQPAVWFGLVSYPGRAWGLNVLLECGAVYRNIPPRAIAFSAEPGFEHDEWNDSDAQTWDCYSSEFALHEYTYLRALGCIARTKTGRELTGEYLFTAAHIDDGWTAEPTQSKEFMFIKLDCGRLTIQPTDRVLFTDESFCEAQWPKGLKRQDYIARCE